MRFAGSAVTSKKSNTKNCFPLYNNINNQELIQEINLGGDSRPNNFLSMELGAWEAFWVPQIGAANDIWSYVRLRICLILMYLLVKICKSLCFYIVFLRFPFNNLSRNRSLLQIRSNNYHICFHSTDDICQVWARLICLHR